MGTLLHASGIAVQLALLLCAVWIGGALTAGCSSTREANEREPDDEGLERGSAPTPATYEAIEVVNGATITGSVTWSGPPPELPVLPVGAHREVCGETQRSPVLAIGRRNGIAGTVVWIEGIRRGRPLALPPGPVEIVAEACAFRPHVVAVPVGAELQLRNADPVLHNVHATHWQGPRREQTWFSRGLPELGATHRALVEGAGVVRLVDDAAHPWMLGWVHAFEHPYFAVSDADGRFQLTGIPAGQYRLRAWHQGVRVTAETTEAGRPAYSAPIVLARPVTVQTGHDTTIDFVLSAQVVAAAGAD